MAFQALFAVEIHSLAFLRRPVGIVTGRASQPRRGFLKTLARTHLFDMADGLRLTIGIDPGPLDEHRPSVAQILTRAKIEFSATISQNPFHSLKMTLIADAFALVWIEMVGIDNRILLVNRFGGFVTVHMLFPRSVASLAANAILNNCSSFKRIAVGLESNAPRVTLNASINNPAFKTRMIWSAKTW